MNHPTPVTRWRGDWDRALSSVIVPMLVAVLVVLAVIVAVSVN